MDQRGFARATAGSWGLIVFLPVSLPLLLAGVVVLDLAVQAVHVTNQSIIFERHPEARSRLVGGYMVFYSIGSALGASTSTMAYCPCRMVGVSMLGRSIQCDRTYYFGVPRFTCPSTGKRRHE